MGMEYNYVPSELVKFFHSWPHLDLAFNKVNATFSLSDSSYTQALIVLAAVCVIWMLLWVLIYMIYFCVLCITHRRDGYQSKASTTKAKRAKWASAILIVATMMALSVGIYGSEMVSFGVNSAHSDLNTASNDISSIKMQTAEMLYSIDTLREDKVSFLQDAFKTAPNLDEVRRPILLNAADGLSYKLANISQSVRETIQTPFTHMSDITEYDTYISSNDKYRRLGTAGALAFLEILLIISLCSVAGCRSRNCLLLCVFVCVFNVILMWCCAAVYTMATVGLADLCMDPANYINSTQSSIGSSIWTYYSYCANFTAGNPFNQVTVQIQSELVSASLLLESMLDYADPQSAFLLQEIRSTLASVKELQISQLELSSSTECHDTYRSYYAAMDALCNTSMMGIVFILSCLLLAGLFAIILVFVFHCASNVRKKRSYQEVSTHDHAGSSTAPSSRSDNPLYYRFSQLSTNDADNIMGSNIIARPSASAPPARGSPPPAYKNHNEFYSTYGNNAAAAASAGGRGGGDNSNNMVANDLNRHSNTFRNT